MGRLTGMFLLGAAALGFLIPPAFADSTDFIGDWANVDTDTGGITHFVITLSTDPEAPKIRVFGKCTPTDCDWGTESLELFGAGLTDTDYQFGVARYTDKVGVVTLTMELEDDGRIFLDWYRDYQDSRVNTHWYDIFAKKEDYDRCEGPDLVVSKIERPEWDGANHRSVIQAVILNIGNSTAGENLARLIDGRLQTDATPYNDVANTPALAPGASTTVTFTLPYWVFDPDANFSVTADYKNLVEECNENNNSRGYNVIG